MPPLRDLRREPPRWPADVYMVKTRNATTARFEPSARWVGWLVGWLVKTRNATTARFEVGGDTMGKESVSVKTRNATTARFEISRTQAYQEAR